MPELSLFQYILVSTASGLLVRITFLTIRFIRNCGVRVRLLERLTDVLNLKQYANEWEATQKVLGDSCSLTLAALLGTRETTPLPDFIVEPEHYDLDTSFSSSVLPLNVIKRVNKELADPHIEYLARGIFDALSLLIVIYRRKQLTLRECKLNFSHRKQAVDIAHKLDEDQQQVRKHLFSLLATHASCTQNATWPNELRMHSFDMTDFQDRLQSFSLMAEADVDDLELAPRVSTTPNCEAG